MSSILEVQLDELTLPNGLVLKMKEPTATNYIRCVEWGNGQPMLITLFEALLCVASINGEAIPPPGSRLKAEALSNKIGRKGIDLIQQWYQQKIYPEITQVQEELGDGASDKTAYEQALMEKRNANLKNALTTQ